MPLSKIIPATAPNQNQSAPAAALEKERKAKTIRGILREIESNWRMKPLYIKRGFKVIKKEGNETIYNYKIEDKISDYHPWLKVKRIK